MYQLIEVPSIRLGRRITSPREGQRRIPNPG